MVFPLVLEQTPSPSVGIWTILGSAAGAILVLILIRIASALRVSGGFSVELFVLTGLTYDEIRVQAKFFNSTSKEFVFSNFGLYRKQGRNYELLLPLQDSPIETGGGHGHWDFATSSLHLEKGASYFGIFHFVKEKLGPGDYALGFANQKGKMNYFSFRR